MVQGDEHDQDRDAPDSEPTNTLPTVGPAIGVVIGIIVVQVVSWLGGDLPIWGALGIVVVVVALVTWVSVVRTPRRR